eukprot:NODE_583_length_727_cov_305.935000_g574_i0.p1 GENE.NODE_583_length_727_cov_305.935000_g574_i0~~NODE_583_length_727_cov_305.935000_g574_i0.p1  ORF type:complete len:148 (-),score=42.27 NODE_583_length_727_cov_305.935000_g574_i0:283-672(-)
MSWTDYTDSLKAYGCKKCGLLGLDGTSWAGDITDGAGLAALFAGNEDQMKASAFEKGAVINGDKFVAVNGTGAGEEDRLTLLAKNAKLGESLAAVKSTQCIVVGITDTDPAGALSAVLVHVGQLAGAGY